MYQLIKCLCREVSLKLKWTPKIAKRNPKLEDRVMSILEKNTNDTPNSSMALIMVEYFNNTVEDNVKLIGQIKMGFQE